MLSSVLNDPGERMTGDERARARVPLADKILDRRRFCGMVAGIGVSAIRWPIISGGLAARSGDPHNFVRDVQRSLGEIVLGQNDHPLPPYETPLRVDGWYIKLDRGRYQAYGEYRFPDDPYEHDLNCHRGTNWDRVTSQLTSKDKKDPIDKMRFDVNDDDEFIFTFWGKGDGGEYSWSGIPPRDQAVEIVSPTDLRWWGSFEDSGGHSGVIHLKQV